MIQNFGENAGMHNGGTASLETLNQELCPQFTYPQLRTHTLKRKQTKRVWLLQNKMHPQI